MCVYHVSRVCRPQRTMVKCRDSPCVRSFSHRCPLLSSGWEGILERPLTPVRKSTSHGAQARGGVLFPALGGTLPSRVRSPGGCPSRIAALRNTQHGPIQQVETAFVAMKSSELRQQRVLVCLRGKHHSRTSMKIARTRYTEREQTDSRERAPRVLAIFSSYCFFCGNSGSHCCNRASLSCIGYERGKSEHWSLLYRPDSQVGSAKQAKNGAAAPMQVCALQKKCWQTRKRESVRKRTLETAFAFTQRKRTLQPSTAGQIGRDSS